MSSSGTSSVGSGKGIEILKVALKTCHNPLFLQVFFRSLFEGLILNETLNAAINALSADSDDENIMDHSVSSVKSHRKDIDFSDVVYYFIDQLPSGVQTAVDDVIK